MELEEALGICWSGLPYGTHAYFEREAATRNVSAVTGACLFARREIYEEARIYGRRKFQSCIQ